MAKYQDYDITKRDDSYSWSYDPKSAIHDNGDGTYTQGGITLKNNYTTDKITPGMSYAIKQAGGNPNAAKAADKYVEDLMGRIGTVSANTGNVLTAQDIQNELNRLGYQASGAGGDWTTVGGQQFLTGGDEYDKLKDTLNNAGYGNMNIYTGQNINGGNYVGNGGNYNSNINVSTGGNLGYNSYIEAYAQALQAQLDRLNEQQKVAEENADKEKRQAYVAMKLGQKALNEQNAASGLQDSGYSEQANIALTADYGNNLNTIASNYQQYLNELNNTYADTALSGAGTLADMAQTEYANQLAAQKYADQLAQQQLENAWYEREYADKLAQNETETNYNNKKTRADAALNLGLWNSDVEDIYGISQSQFNSYMNEQKKNSVSSSSSSSISYTLDDEDDDDTPKVAKEATVQDNATATKRANARNSYANEIKELETKYGLTPAVATDVRNAMKQSGLSAAEVIQLYYQTLGVEIQK